MNYIHYNALLNIYRHQKNNIIVHDPYSVGKIDSTGINYNVSVA